MTPDPFDLSGRVAVITGGYGTLGSSIARGLARAGARVAILGRRREPAEAAAGSLTRDGLEAIAVVADVLAEDRLDEARDQVIDAWGRVDILVNAAGGNVAEARSDDRPVFDVPPAAFDEVVRLNLHGTVLPTLAFGRAMAAQERGSIVTISSMAASRALSGVMGYSAAKAAVDNATRWLAVELARTCGDGIRVNAVAPGFFIADQNRAVLLDRSGEYTDRARAIIRNTPMGRFGRPEELIGPVLWLCSDAASFVTGAVIPVDGGFSVYSGV